MRKRAISLCVQKLQMAAQMMTGKTGSAMYMVRKGGCLRRCAQPEPWEEPACRSLAQAPEVFLNQAYNERSDVFSFGMMLLEALRGVLNIVYLDYAGGQMAQATMDYAARMASGWRPQMPEEWPSEVQGLITRMLHKDSAERPSFEQVGDALNGFLVSGLVEQYVNERAAKRHPVACTCSLM